MNKCEMNLDSIRGEELKNFIQETLEKFCIKHKALIEFYDFELDRLPETRKLVYEVSRTLAAEGKAK